MAINETKFKKKKDANLPPTYEQYKAQTPVNPQNTTQVKFNKDKSVDYAKPNTPMQNISQDKFSQIKNQDTAQRRDPAFQELQAYQDKQRADTMVNSLKIQDAIDRAQANKPITDQIGKIPQQLPQSAPQANVPTTTTNEQGQTYIPYDMNAGLNQPQVFQKDQNPTRSAIAMSLTGGGLPAGAIPSAITRITIPQRVALSTKSTWAFFGGISGLVGKYTTNKRQAVKESNKRFTDSVKNIKLIINEQNTNPNDLDNIQAYNTELSNIQTQEATLKALTKGWVSRELSGGIDELAGIEDFNRIKYIYDRRLADAVNNPDPLKQIPVDLTNEDLTQ